MKPKGQAHIYGTGLNEYLLNLALGEALCRPRSCAVQKLQEEIPLTLTEGTQATATGGDDQATRSVSSASQNTRHFQVHFLF